MRSTRWQLLVTLAAAAVAAGFFAHRGLPPKVSLAAAATAGGTETVRRCLAWGADPDPAIRVDGGDVTYSNGLSVPLWRTWRPLHKAIVTHRDDLARLLVAYGADVTTPSLAEGYLEGDNSRLSWDEDPYSGPPLYLCGRFSASAELVAAILEAGADPNQRGLGNERPIFAAVRNDHYRMVELLIEHRADVNPGSSLTGSPLETAIEKQDQRMIDLLRRHGARE